MQGSYIVIIGNLSYGVFLLMIDRGLWNGSRDNG